MRIISKSKYFILLVLLLVLGHFYGCSSDGTYTISDKVKASRWDGSVAVVESFLKKQYLRDPESYKSVEWGKLIKNSDGSFQVTHRFSARNGFGGINTETVLFCISSTGEDVHICTINDEQLILKNEQKAKERLADNDYIGKEFKNTLFEGTITETIDGIDEKYTFKGTLSKNDNIVEGNMEAIEKNIKYRVSGNIEEDGKIKFELENLSNGLIIHLPGFITANNFSAYSAEHKISFSLTQSDQL